MTIVVLPKFMGIGFTNMNPITSLHEDKGIFHDSGDVVELLPISELPSDEGVMYANPDFGIKADLLYLKEIKLERNEMELFVSVMFTHQELEFARENIKKKYPEIEHTFFDSAQLFDADAIKDSDGKVIGYENIRVSETFGLMKFNPEPIHVDVRKGITVSYQLHFEPQTEVEIIE